MLVMSEPSRLGREQSETGYVLMRIPDGGAQVFYYLDDCEAKLDSAIGKFIEAGLFSALLPITLIPPIRASETSRRTMSAQRNVPMPIYFLMRLVN